MEVDDWDIVLIVVVEVLASHAPDEGVVIGASCCVDAPFRRHDGLLVVEPNNAALLRLTHDVSDGLIFWKVEIVVGFNTAAVCVRRHRIPGSTGIELCQSELKLARAFFENVVYDEFVDGAVVALFQ